VPGLALLRLSQGETRAAPDLLEASLSDATMPRLDRARPLPASVEILLAAGQAAEADRAAQELRSIAGLFASAPLQASAAYAAGLLLPPTWMT
jgi:hypothetical protein